MNSYRSYHTAFKLLYARKQLPDHLCKLVPASTRHTWKRKTIDSFWSPIPVSDTQTRELLLQKLTDDNRRLKSILRSLLYLLLLYRDLTTGIVFTTAQARRVTGSMETLLRYCNSSYTTTLLRYLPFSLKQWKAWTSQRNCPASLHGLCRKQFPGQLTHTDTEAIRLGCSDEKYRHWPLCSIYYQLLREQKINCSRSTFYKYCRLLDITRKRLRKPVNYKPLKAPVCFAILHQDITIFKTLDGVRHYIYVIRDNYSRAILACKAATQYSSSIAKEALSGVLENFGLMHREGLLITDDGSENKGALEAWLQKPGMLWKKLIAQLDIVQSNSMAEAANKIIKYRFLYPRPVANTEVLINLLEMAVDSYNDMPNAQLYGFTPNEVLAGDIPDKSKFKAAIVNDRTRRIAENRNSCCVSFKT